MSGTPGSRNTAYPFNTRANRVPGTPLERGWHARINALLANDFAFLPYRYGDEGHLFRGMRTGLAVLHRGGEWQLSTEPDPLGALERELEVFLLSHELADALSVARLWEASRDAALIVFAAAEFNRRWGTGAAAVLGFAEPGVVFKYPFVVEPLALGSASAILVTANYDGPEDGRFIVLPESLNGDRRAVETWVIDALRRRGIAAAEPLATDRYPRRG